MQKIRCEYLLNLGVRSYPEAEQLDLYSCESVLEMDEQNFVEVGRALGRIRDGRLYRGDFPSFDIYCRQKWQYARRYVDDLIASAELSRHLSANCAQQKPWHESQLRPLIGLTKEKAQAAWDHAVQMARGQKSRRS